MEEIQSQQPSTGDGAKNGTPDAEPMQTHIRLPQLPYLTLGQSEHNAWKASDEAFFAFAQSIVPVKVEEGDSLERSWTWEERRDFVNWCLDEGVLVVQDGRLVPVEEEQIPTAPLSHDTEADAQESAEDAGFLHDVERARPLVHANPEISAQELAEALGLHSSLYAKTLKVSINAHQTSKKGAEACSPD
jgi:hypothetical protein